MKKYFNLKCIISAVLLAIAIIAATVCSSYMPMWLTITIISFCTIFSIIIIYFEFAKRQDKIETSYLELSSAINDALIKIEESANKHEHSIACFISQSHEGLDQHLSTLEKQNSERSQTIVESINSATTHVLADICNVTEGIGQIQHNFEGGQKLVVDKIDSVFEQGTNLGESISSSSKLFASKSSELSETIISTSDSLKDTIRNDFTEQTEIISSAITKSTQNQEDVFTAVQNKINETGESIHRAGKEQQDCITTILTQSQHEIEHQLTQLTTSTIEVRKQVEECLKQSIDSIERSAEHTNQNINQLKDTETEHHNSIIDQISTISKQDLDIKDAVFSYIDTKAEQIQKDYENLLTANRSFSETVLNGIEVLSNNSTDMNNSICSSIDSLLKDTSKVQASIIDASNEICTKVDKALSDNGETIKAKFTETLPLISVELDSVKSVIAEIKEDLLQVGNEQNQNIIAKYAELSEASIVIKEKLGEIEKQYSEIMNLINEDNEEYDKAAEVFIDGIHNQYVSLSNSVNTLMAKAENLGDRIEELKSISNNNEIVKSINSAIEELSGKINGAVIDINKKVIESHLLQSDFIKDEVSKLQILLRTLLNNTAQGEAPSQGPKSIIGQTKHLDPSRTESIEDVESKNTVLNQYKNNILVKSTMKNQKGTVIYELEYHNGKISRSKSFDESGALRIEQNYYENGQVHFREEYRKDGKHSTEFDKNGQIK